MQAGGATARLVRTARAAVIGCAAVAAGLMPAADASALDFRSAGDAPVVLYDAPSTRATRILLLSPGSPVEVMTALDGWLRVREPGGRLAWAESKAVVTRRTLMVSVASATIRAAADAAATPVFEAKQGVILELLEPVAGGWSRVKHRDGLSGFVRTSEVWGL